MPVSKLVMCVPRCVGAEVRLSAVMPLVSVSLECHFGDDDLDAHLGEQHVDFVDDLADQPEVVDGPGHDDGVAAVIGQDGDEAAEIGGGARPRPNRERGLRGGAGRQGLGDGRARCLAGPGAR